MENKTVSAFIFASMLSGNYPYNDVLGNFDNDYFFDEEVNNCQIKLYIQLIKWINEGLSFEEIDALIDKIDFDEYKVLSIDKQTYVKHDAHNVLVLRRKNNERK